MMSAKLHAYSSDVVDFSEKKYIDVFERRACLLVVPTACLTSLGSC